MHSLSKDLIYSVLKRDSYLSHYYGNSNVLLTAPHGGGMKPFYIPKRKYGNRSADSYTRRLLQATFEKFNRKKPYYICSDIHRSRVDLNRDIKEGCQGNAKMEEVWREWNKLIYTMCQEILSRHHKGLYIDIHSHNLNDKFQIGYGLSAKAYNDVRSGWPTKEKSTLDSILDSKDKWEVLFGDGSFVDSLSGFGYEIFIPISDKNYLNGGRNVREFSGYGIGAIQLECPISVLREDLKGVSFAVSSAIRLFREKFLL